MYNDLLLCDNDLDVSVSGDLGIIQDDLSIIQAAINNINIRLHELPLQYDRGNQMQSARIKTLGTGLADIESYCRKAISYDFRVKSIPAMEITRIDNSSCRVDFILETIDSHTIEAWSIVNI